MERYRSSSVHLSSPR